MLKVSLNYPCETLLFFEYESVYESNIYIYIYIYIHGECLASVLMLCLSKFHRIQVLKVQ